MAGAVSAGAYTAGVIDFLLQALEEWHKQKASDSDEAPPHEVKIKAITGASAGGMTGAILAAMLNDRFSHITSLPGRRPSEQEIQQNKLYNSWVKQVDISKLLGQNDLETKGSKVKSLLDSTVLNDIADSAIRFSSSKQWRPYVNRPLHLHLTLTNLQGVPYDIAFQGRSKRGYAVSQHTDYMHFMMDEEAPDSKEATWLNSKNNDHKNWSKLKQTALATGAFPGGLAPRVINRSFDSYDYRSWPIPQRPEEGDKKQSCITMETIKPSWPEHRLREYHFLSVDGGVMDNEPMELARRTLAGESGFNPRDPENAHRAVIMVDPFPNEKNVSIKAPKELEEYDIVNTFTGLFGSLISQARFKPDELMLANADEIYSRFLIAPTRYDNNEKAKYPIASGFMGGFGGFLSEKFRMHDFQLGRRNCQQFLARYLSIPIEKARKNPVFAGYSEQDFQRFSIDRNGKAYVPLIPLMGSAKEEAFPLRWETLKMTPGELDTLKEQIGDRTKIVINRLLEQYIDGGFSRKMAKLAASFKRGQIVDKIMNNITDELEEFDLKTQ